jgi:hypothetical protein
VAKQRQRFVELANFGKYSRIPVLQDLQLVRELQAVEPTCDQNVEYRPCEVTLRDGSTRDRVIFAEADTWIRYWGAWPENDSGKSAISLFDVQSVRSSPSRLPASLANKLYCKGETSMGGYAFGLVMRNGDVLSAVTGDVVDFLQFPEGVSLGDVVDVIHGYHDLHERWIPSADFAWCLYHRDVTIQPF